MGELDGKMLDAEVESDDASCAPASTAQRFVKSKVRLIEIKKRRILCVSKLLAVRILISKLVRS